MQTTVHVVVQKIFNLTKETKEIAFLLLLWSYFTDWQIIAAGVLIMYPATCTCTCDLHLFNKVYLLYTVYWPSSVSLYDLCVLWRVWRQIGTVHIDFPWTSTSNNILKQKVILKQTCLVLSKYSLKDSCLCPQLEYIFQEVDGTLWK